MLDEHVELLERALIEQKLDALARRQLAPTMLRRNPTLPSPQTRLRTTGLKAFKHVFHGMISGCEVKRTGDLAYRPAGQKSDVRYDADHFPRSLAVLDAVMSHHVEREFQ